MKKKIILVLIILVMLVFTSGITYSVFNAETSLYTPDQQIAKFIFNTEKTNGLDLPISNIKPGDKEEYLFSVTNAEDQSVSNVDINYQIKIKTFHFIPLKIELYLVDEEVKLFGVCDETHSRNEYNELVCNMPIAKFNHTEAKKTDYRLQIEFPEEYNDESYIGLVDYLNLELNSWQIID